MNTLTLQKLKDLWERESQRENSVVDRNDEIYRRAQEIFDTLRKLLENTDSNIFDGWETIPKAQEGRENVVRSYEDNTTDNQKTLIREVLTICPGLSDKNRKIKFYITSNTLHNDFESSKIDDGIVSRVQPIFISYNHPAVVAQYLLEMGKDPDRWGWWRNGTGTRDECKNTCKNRFPMKYLWMLKTPGVIPILSLQSFYNLAPLLGELDQDFKTNFNFFCDGHAERWEQSLDEFTTQWQDISERLYQALGIDTEQDKNEKRETLAKFLFYVSLADNVRKDATTMLGHGNHAIILYGPPGTGKTFQAKQIACQMLGIEFDPQKEPKWEIENERGSWSYRRADNEEAEDDGMYKVIQFHPNYTYQDFIGGIFPNTDGNGRITYEKKEGIFQILCKLAQKNDKKKFILIVDEINRANLSAVFGELMYCLEYRGKSLDIPLFGSFSIPSNIYIIGTMNNTDKSLIGFDLALRRRFGFIKVMPDMDVLESLSIDMPNELATRANELNQALKDKLGLSEDKQIGHAYFMKIKDFVQDQDGLYKLTCYALEQLWDYHISPLLEEYLGMEFDDKQAEINELKRKFTAPLPTGD